MSYKNNHTIDLEVMLELMNQCVGYIVYLSEHNPKKKKTYASYLKRIRDHRNAVDVDDLDCISRTSIAFQGYIKIFKKDKIGLPVYEAQY
jgi:hypothetical protein